VIGIVKWLLIIGAAMAMVFAGWTFLEKRCNSACKDVLAAWEADKAMRIKRTTEITNMLSERMQAAMDAAAKLKGQVDEAVRTQAERVAAVPAGTRITLPRPVARVLDHGDSASRAARGPINTGTEARADPVPATPATVVEDGVVYDGREFAEYLKNADAAYADAYRLWKEAREREDALRAAYRAALGLPPETK
jgi:hypothetical protein